MVDRMPVLIDWMLKRVPSNQHDPPVSALLMIVAAPFRLVTLVKFIPVVPLMGGCAPVAAVSCSMAETSVPAAGAVA